MLMINATIPDIVLICVTSLIGMYFIGMAVVGHWQVHMNPIQRIVAAAGGLCMIVPGLATDVVGIALCAVVAFWQYSQKKRAVAA